jgi:hypothetical protein
MDKGGIADNRLILQVPASTRINPVSFCFSVIDDTDMLLLNSLKYPMISDNASAFQPSMDCNQLVALSLAALCMHMRNACLVFGSTTSCGVIYLR